jgi:hypothetical protein
MVGLKKPQYITIKASHALDIAHIKPHMAERQRITVTKRT